MTDRAIAILLATLLLISVVAPAATATFDEGLKTPSQGQTAEQSMGDQSVKATVGQQLSTVTIEIDSDVRSEVEETSFDLRFKKASDDERARSLANRADDLAERAIAIRQEYEAATQAHEAGEISDSEYAERIATLSVRADNLAKSARKLRDHAARVSAIELRAEGFTPRDLQVIDEQLDTLTGTGAQAILQRFTGRKTGEIRIETRDGLSIEVEGEEGEFSREIKRPRDENTNITVSQAAALQTARTELGSPPAGNWALERATIHDDSGYYKFELVLTGATATGEAEVRIDGSSGDMFRLETEIDADDDMERGGEVDELAVLITEGSPTPNETVTLRVLARGEPAADARVTMNGEFVGRTDSEGKLTVSLPMDDAAIRVQSGDAEGELELEFDRTAREDQALHRNLNARITTSDSHATLAVQYDGSPLEGAAVTVEGRDVGVTDSNGTVTFDTPDQDDLDVEIQKGAFLAEFEFERIDGEFRLVEEEFEDRELDEDDDRDTETDTESETENEFDGDLAVRIVEGEPAPSATVTIGVTGNGSPVANASVLVNDERVGITDADGQLQVTFPDADRVEIEVEFGNEDADLEFRFDESRESDS